MKKGYSYSDRTDKDVKHPIIKKLLSMGYFDIHLIYASHLATDSGWTVISVNHLERSEISKLSSWLGFTIPEALKLLNSIQ